MEAITERIQFCDVDATGVMWHGNYIKYFEKVRCGLFEKLGFSYETIFAMGYQLPVISLQIKYIKPCIYNQKIKISAELEKSQHLIIVHHEVTDFYSNNKISIAETRCIAFCIKTKKTLLELPDFIVSKIFTG